MYTHAETTRRELLSAPERVAEPLFSAMALVVLGGFFVTHQSLETGFFTVRFGPVEMLCLYGPLVLSLAAPLTRALYGHRMATATQRVPWRSSHISAQPWLGSGYCRCFPSISRIWPTYYQQNSSSCWRG